MWKGSTLTQMFSFQCVLVFQLQVKSKEVNILQHLEREYGNYLVNETYGNFNDYTKARRASNKKGSPGLFIVNCS